MRWPAVFFLVAALTATGAGCRSSTEHLEAELRARDGDLRTLRAELERTDAYNQYLQRELRHAPHTVAGAPGPDALPPAVAPAGLKNVTLGRQTGGFEEDGIPGDEALQVVVEPRDADNHIVKAPGGAQVTALEVMPEGVKKPLCSWQVPAEDLRKTWRVGLLSTGYTLVLPWKNWPANCKLRVVLQFLSEDNRLFEADRDVTVRIAPALYRKGPAADPPGPALPPLPSRPGDMPPAETTPPPPEGEALPPPRKVEPDKDKKPEPEKKTEKKDESLPEVPLPPGPDGATRSLKGLVEILRPVALREGD